MTNPVSSLAPHQPGQPAAEGSIFLQRDYNQCSFEWQIFGLKWLKSHVEDQPAGLWAVEGEMEDPEGLPEALRRGVVIGEGWYKLDIGECGMSGRGYQGV